MQNKNKGFTNIQHILPTLAQQHQVERFYQKYKVFNAWEKVSTGFFTESQELTKPADFSNGKLIIGCLSPELGTRLRQVAEQLIRALNDFLGKRVIFSLIIEV